MVQIIRDSIASTYTFIPLQNFHYLINPELKIPYILNFKQQILQLFFKLYKQIITDVL